MRIGVPAEVKSDEYRVALTPAGALELSRRGHEVTVEHDAGVGSGISDEDFVRVGARIGDVADAWSADLVLKVKEPQPGEFAFLREDQVLFTYLHLAANPGVAEALVAAGGTGIAYETVEDGGGRLPLLAPMSEIAGRLSVQAGARYLEKAVGGRGVLLGGVAGVAPGNVLVIGAGIVGINAAMVAIGMQAHVSVLDTNLDRLRELELVLGGRVELLYSTQLAIEELLPTADLVVGAVLLPGARAPRLVSREALGFMRAGSVIVDVAVDQGGCFATTRPTTHSDPVYLVDEVIHYCVANMPGAVPVTSTRALCNATLPHVTWLADMGVNGAIDAHPGLEPGVNVRGGRVVNPTVAEALRT
ncbi:MAG TPA: alanine dehydrogenase [Miltoncostaea sp.]|nr:alanine dehydrogenase [Miltoncostaea sp.]